MTPVVLAVASTLGAWSGMAMLGLQAPSHRHRLGLPPQSAGPRLRRAAAGAALLILSLSAAIAANGLSFGIVLWLCQIGMLGLILICLWPYHPVWVARASVLSAFAAPSLYAAGRWL